MKNLYKLIIFFISVLLQIPKVSAYAVVPEKHENYGINTCTEDNAYWNPTETQLGTAGSSSHAIIYDVTWVKMDGDTMKIYGWAFDKGKNNIGNNGIQIIASTATSTSKINSGNSINYNINYAKEGQNANGKGLTYYDLSYWNCFRNQYNKCTSNNMETLRGGFEASLNLNALKEGTYRVYLKVGNDVGWTELTASKTSEDQSVKTYSADSEYDIDISGFGDKATVKVDYGRLTGSNGLLCSSPVTKTNKEYSYFVDEAAYGISGVTTACRGDCKSTSINYSQRLFKLKVSSTPNIKGYKTYYGPGNGLTAYAPASWLNFSGHVKISKVKKIQVDTCGDKVKQTECDTTGTQAKFYENEDLLNCTLVKNHSGFTIMENDYCEVACKDDFDVLLPSIKNVTAGQYFSLDDYTPTITGTRTCVTSKIDVNKFKSDLSSQGNLMKNTYNTYTDYEYIYDNLTGSKGDTTNGKTQTTCSKYAQNVDGTRGECLSYNYCEYKTYTWKIDPVIRDGRTIYEGDSGKWYSACLESDGTLENNLSEVKDDYNPSTAYNEYLNAKKTYENIQKKYNECSDWTNNKKYNYEFKPKVTFGYEDKDATVFSGSKEYTYNYDKNNEVSKTTDSKEIYYWTINNMNNNYETEASNIKTEDINIYECSGSYCDGDVYKKSFNTNTYIRRNEKITYTYTLPLLYTKVPTGDISIYPGGKNSLSLNANSVPVNINTPSGTYNYYFEITDFADNLRQNHQTTNIETRIEKLFFNDSNNTYFCEYNVENDIYIPGNISESGRKNYFYRTVDLDNINPIGRTLGYNWSNNIGNKVQESIKESGTNYDALTSKDVFTFVLTPAIMEKIRDYNSSQNNTTGYLNWETEMSCTDYGKKGGYYCESNFLTCITSSGQKGEHCDAIFGNTLNNYSRLTDYNVEMLDDNRETLIKKMNSLLGR